MNDSSSEVDGDDFRAKTVGTREAEVCINIQIKKSLDSTISQTVYITTVLI